VPAKSESARSRWFVPRWVFIAWLWACVANQLLDDFKIVCPSWTPTCRLWFDANWVFGLFPGGLDALVLPFTYEKPLYTAPIVLGAAAMTWGVLRYLPRRLSLKASLIVVVSWYGLSLLVTALLAIDLMLHHIRR
jgi:hypothetical protein